MSKPRLAILGAGPTGLEAALAALDGGYPFTLYEAAPKVAGYVRSWGHVRLFSPWEIDVSPRMWRYLEKSPPDDASACPTGNELIETVFDPLASLPAVAEHLELATRVVEVGRRGLVKSDEIGTQKRAEQPFRLLVEGNDGRERIDYADIVLDCTGSYGHPNRLGDGGIYAPGERAANSRIERSIPDVRANPERWSESTTLVVGAGHSAQTAVRDLAELAEGDSSVKIVWAIRRPTADWPVDPEDALPQRAALADRANQLASGTSSAVEMRTGVVVEEVRVEEVQVEAGRTEALQTEAPQTNGNAKLHVQLRSADGSIDTVTADRVLALTGGVGDHHLYRQLQVHECYATSGPMKLAAALLGSSSSDCLAQTTHGADTLANPEPGFFILGSKSYGRNNSFLMRVGWQQVEEVFGLLP